MSVADPTRRLAGVRFESQPPVLPEALPRMDIAVFVGFASAGPANLPIVIEDVKHFSDIFGDELVLAWDAVRSAPVPAHLTAAVRTFFQNGGKRCWVIRVSGPAETDVYALPNLAEINGGRLATAWARARSPGSWFDGFECATAMTIQAVDVTGSEDADFSTLKARLPRADTVTAGDLLRLTWEESALQGLEFFFAVTGVTAREESPPSGDHRLFELDGTPLAWLQAVTPSELAGNSCRLGWTRRPATDTELPDIVWVSGTVEPPSSTPAEGQALLITLDVPTDFQPPVGALLETSIGQETFWLVVSEVRRSNSQEASSPPLKHARLSGRTYRLLAGAPGLARSSRPIAQKISFELEVRRGDNDNMRLTELGFGPANARYWNALPTDLQLYDSPDLAQALRYAAAETYSGLWSEAQEPRFPLAGLHGGWFIPLGMGTLAEPFVAATHSRRTEGERDGWDPYGAFNAKLFLDPDLIETGTLDLMNEADFLRYQSPQPRRLKGIHAALEVDEATLIAVPDAVHRGWKITSAMSGPAPAASAPLPHPSWGLADDCAAPASPPIAVEPRWDKFLECDLRVLTPPVLELSSGPDVVGDYQLSWTTGDIGVEFVLEEAVEADFSDAVVVYQGPELQNNWYGRSSGQYYHRVRSMAGTETSEWSNGVSVWVPPPNRWLENPEAEFRIESLLDIHRALLRMSAARGDILAVLSLPEHFRENETLAYLDILKNTAPDGLSSADQLTSPIGPGEAQVFSYAAVYHPWVLESDTELGVRQTPPDGFATGIIARRSIARGAWIAPANELWRGVIGLSPVLDSNRRLELLQTQLNQVRQEPTGFLTLNADTLSGEDYQDLRPIGVRRLLILLRRAALRLGMTYVFEPNGDELRRLVQRGFESLLDQLYVRGAFAGATRATSYQIVTDASINTAQSVDQGRFRVDLKVAPSLPLSFITVRLIQTGGRSFATEIL